jgi:DNA-binding transcriptional regulator PaaX
MTEVRRWLLLIYRVPSQPSRLRVAVWRDLKRLGALYLQQAVCVLPDVSDVRSRLEEVRRRIDEMDGGKTIFLELDSVTDFRANSAKEYAEIVEECETKFFKEIEFERFRENYTFEEAEEIRQDLEKLRRWLAKIESRDWLGADGRAKAHEKVAECERLMDEFEADVYERANPDDA